MTLKLIGNGVYVAYGSVCTEKVAAFDLDWTLVRPVRGKFPTDADDWAFLPHRVATLQQYQDAGWTLAIFSNQAWTGRKLPMALQRVRNILATLQSQGIHPWVFVATLKNSYRKPETGMWSAFRHQCPEVDPSQSLFVGDAAGRPQDFSASDAEFAHNAGLAFFVPESIFPAADIVIPETQTMFIFVGMPGSGKTTFYDSFLKSRGWIHATLDGTMHKLLTTIESGLKAGRSIAVDAANPSVDARRYYIDLAVKYQVPTMILYFVRNGDSWNKMRAHPLPTVTFSTYFKHLTEPTPEIDGVPVVQIE